MIRQLSELILLYIKRRVKKNMVRLFWLGCALTKLLLSKGNMNLFRQPYTVLTVAWPI